MADLADSSVPAGGSARDALGDQEAAGRALERALDLAEPDGLLLPFLLHPAPGLLERQTRHRTAHAVLIGEILGVLAGSRPAAELYVSVNTVKTHIRNLYAKLGTRHRAEAVARARGLGLLAPSVRSAR